MAKAKLKIVRGDAEKLSKWPPVTWQHPEPKRRPDAKHQPKMTPAQLHQWAAFHGERPAHRVWPFIALAVMAMGAMMIAAAMG